MLHRDFLTLISLSWKSAETSHWDTFYVVWKDIFFLWGLFAEWDLIKIFKSLSRIVKLRYHSTMYWILWLKWHCFQLSIMLFLTVYPSKFLILLLFPVISKIDFNGVQNILCKIRIIYYFERRIKFGLKQLIRCYILSNNTKIPIFGNKIILLIR